MYNLKTFLTKHKGALLILLSIVLYFFFGYFLERTQFELFFSLWFLLFTCFYFLQKSKQISFTNLVGVSILFRLVFLFAIPNLSQDFYRFIWDGRMILEGINPYLSLPKMVIEQHNYPIHQAEELYAGMGELNGSHYTNYAPINQICFLIVAFFANKSILGSVIVLRLIIILADIGILYFGKKLLERLNLPINTIFWYLLNPFIIIEMTGNLHFEPVMLFFLVFSLYKLHQQKWIWAAVLLACSISVKLIPLLFLPLFYQWFTSTSLRLRSVTTLSDQKKRNVIANLSTSLKTGSTKQSLKKGEITSSKTPRNDDDRKWISVFSGMTMLIAFYIIVLGTTILFFLPFYSSEFINNYSNSVGLWFRNFEFNASFYYVFREIGYSFRGWNEIAIIGKITPLLTILFLIFITFFRRNKNLKQLITALLFGLSFYYFTTTTMHPWYIATLIILSVFTKYRFPIVWSLVIVLSYQAYANTPWQENLWFVGAEYLVVYGYLIWELRSSSISKKKKTTII